MANGLKRSHTLAIFFIFQPRFQWSTVTLTTIHHFKLTAQSGALLYLPNDWNVTETSNIKTKTTNNLVVGRNLEGVSETLVALQRFSMILVRLYICQLEK